MLKLFLDRYLHYLIVLLFFIAYSVLSLIRHQNYGSFGFDLGIADQIVWKYSKLTAPITTIDHTAFIPELFVHLEFIYILLAPFYWIYSHANTLLVLQAFVVCLSGIPVYLLAKHKGLTNFLSLSILISYLMFYGVQNALWFDVHSTTFGAGFLAWFIYFLDRKNHKLAWLFFLLTIISKENYALITLLVSIVYFYLQRDKYILFYASASIAYLILVFGIYFPYQVPGGYRFESSNGLLGGINLFDMVATHEKRQVIFYTFAWTGFLSLLNPIVIIPMLGNIALYFIIGREVSTAQGLFLQYRIELAPLLFLPTIYGINKLKSLNNVKTGIFLLICALLLQYVLHLPLSYLTKKWFWAKPESAQDINKIIEFIPEDASIVTQNNITPHLSQRDEIFTLWPDKKLFTRSSPCSQPECAWFRWSGKPEYLIVSVSSDWDSRHLLTDRERYIEGLKNMEKSKIITKFKQINQTIIYKIN